MEISGILSRHLKWRKCGGNKRKISSCFFEVKLPTGHFVRCSVFGPDADVVYQRIKVGASVALSGNYSKKNPGNFSANAVGCPAIGYEPWSTSVIAKYGSVSNYERQKKKLKQEVAQKRAFAHINANKDRDIEVKEERRIWDRVRYFNKVVDERELTRAEQAELCSTLTEAMKKIETLRNRVDSWREIAGTQEQTIIEMRRSNGKSEED